MKIPWIWGPSGRLTFVPLRPFSNRQFNIGGSRIVVIAFSILVLALAGAPTPVRAEIITEIGAEGTPGADGKIPGQSGTNGGSGQSVTADAGFSIPNGDLSNRATATGGRGGRGGNGGAGDAATPNGGNGGNGGAGGDATARSSADAVNANVRSTAIGGQGGVGGTGGAGTKGGNNGAGGRGGNGGAASAVSLNSGPGVNGDTISIATGGDGGSGFNGGNGGASTSQATGRSATSQSTGGNGGSGINGGDGGDATATGTGTGFPLAATAIGGNGGTSSGAGHTGGAGGGGSVHAFYSATTAVEALTDAKLQGGNGGNGIDGANGGTGASSNLSNPVSASVGSGLIEFAQEAIGGNGGSSDGGTAGVAGNATSELTFTNGGVGDVGVYLYIQAPLPPGVGSIGGRGGSGAGGGTNGAQGGSAETFFNITNERSIDFRGYAIGGAGGDAVGAGTSGGNGGLATVNLSSGTSTGNHNVAVHASQVGGAGGNGCDGATGGTGASSTLRDAVTASSGSGIIELDQFAAGGNGGSSSGGVAGAAGNAISELTFSNPGSGAIRATALGSTAIDAQGGAGGSGLGGGTNGANGGTAEASFNITGKNEVSVQGTSFGGNGGGAVGHGATAGNGGVASVKPSRVASTMTGGNFVDGTPQVFVYGALFLFGGNGGNGAQGADGGNGADELVIDAISGTSIGPTLDIGQSLSGGNAGSSDTGIPGRAGNAVSILHAINPGGGALDATVFDRGGAGGNSGMGLPTPGGDAVAITIATGSKALTVFANSIGGDGGLSTNSSGNAAQGGNATALATAFATTKASGNVRVGALATGGVGAVNGSAFARALGTGSSSEQGAVFAIATSGGGNVSSVQATTNASLPGTPTGAATSVTESRAAFGQAAPSSNLASGLQAASFAIAAPRSSDLASFEAGNPTVTSMIGTGPDVFGLMTLGASYSQHGSGASATYESIAAFTLNITSPGPQTLKLGLLNPVITGNGFDSLQLTIMKGGSVMEMDNFTNADKASAFFTDHVLTFSGIDLSNAATLTFTLDLTASEIGDGFRTDLVAAVPEPGINILICVGALMILSRCIWLGSRSARRVVVAIAFSALILALAGTLSPVRAEIISEIGAEGAPGADGKIPGQSGTNGGSGQSVTADAGFSIPNGDLINRATATGGRGGSGGNGAAGDAATPNGGNGGNGGAGGDATARSAGNIKGADVRSTANGGQGGVGGTGGAAGKGGSHGTGGDGGAGGAANSEATAQGPNSQIRSDCIAGGGSGGSGTDGGNGGAGGAANSQAITHGGVGDTTANSIGSGGSGGSGANGGDGAEVTATAVATGVGTGELRAQVFASGGNGGAASGVGNTGGDGAGGYVHASGSSNTGGIIHADVTLYAGYGGTGLNGANGGAGGSCTLINPVSASVPTGFIIFSQAAYAGRGGSSDGGIAGAGGDATSDLTYTATGNARIEVPFFSEEDADTWFTSRGGTGGNGLGHGSNGADGGNAEASFHIAGGGYISFRADVFGGRGGSAVGAGTSAGNGGVATVSPSSIETTGDNIYLEAKADVHGGDGGFGFSGAHGGNGADETLINAISATSSGVPGGVQLVQHAYAGSAGGSDTGMPGIAGNATSILSASNLGSLNIENNAGGGGGASNSIGDTTANGNATAISIANSLQRVYIYSVVGGSNVTSIGIGTAPGLVSILNAAYASSAGLARSSGVAASGGLHSYAEVQGDNLGVYAGSRAVLPGTATNSAMSTTEARATIGQAAPASALANGLQGASFVTGAPRRADLVSFEAGNPNVASAIGTGPDVLGLMTLGAGYSKNGSGASATYESFAGFNVNITSAGPQTLKLGLLNPVITGNGFDSLKLTITNGQSVIETDIFTSASDALAFFTDHVLIFKGVASPSAFAFTLDLTASEIGDSFRTDLVAAVPEPSINLLICIGTLMILLRRHRLARRSGSLAKVGSRN